MAMEDFRNKVGNAVRPLRDKNRISNDGLGNGRVPLVMQAGVISFSLKIITVCT